MVFKYNLKLCLKQILAQIRADRMDWFFGVDMGIYYDPNLPAIVPDGFLGVGVPRFIDKDLPFGSRAGRARQGVTTIV